ncbi:hypothetical protein CU254_27010 [Amycolatopsis sp. AA4]|uniref:hypothetical protein n=1 Tax=Actinomycetes TaxID=1760 RepID=UPI0001B56620|nr:MULTISPECIES: hypothetical protein [Actinomycetes]ATY13672.1 hypothetical protein CU254_27010 [Amycolatopsis sp. AA4]EFL09651.1 predicted protein [Streptomyces sp. AA4]
MDTEPSRTRTALTGALHGTGAYLVCALVLCALAAGLTVGAKELTLPAVLGIIVLASFLHFGVFALPVAAGIGALVASLGQPKRPARRVWLTVSALTVLVPIVFVAAMSAHWG